MKIAILPGDGIGPEIMAQAVKVLDALRTDRLKIAAIAPATSPPSKWHIA